MIRKSLSSRVESKRLPAGSREDSNSAVKKSVQIEDADYGDSSKIYDSEAVDDDDDDENSDEPGDDEDEKSATNNQSDAMEDQGAVIERTRNIRPQAAAKERHMEDSAGEDSDEEGSSCVAGGELINFESEDFNQPALVNALPALRSYFMGRLHEVLSSLGDSAEVRQFLEGWHVQIVKRAGGLTQGLLDILYFSADGKRYKTRVEVASAMKLLPPTKALREMTPQQYFLTAMETRERCLVSQQLGLHNYSCEAVHFDGNKVHLTAKTTAGEGNGKKKNSDCDEEVSAADKMRTDVPHTPDISTATDVIQNSSEPNPSYFTMGNAVVLHWGVINTKYPGFHSSTQLFPIGFCCIRQEHDVVLNQVVDCYCEIDAIYDGTGNNNGISYLQFMRNPPSSLGSEDTLLLRSNCIGDPQTVEAFAEYCHREDLEAHGNAVGGRFDDELNKDAVDQSSISFRERPPVKHNVVPLFRITVQWQLNDGEKLLSRVYEARNPQQVWQAAMLEDAGVDDLHSAIRVASEHGGQMCLSISAVDENSENVELNDGDDFEPLDEEETTLRSQVREQRRAFFRLLRNEQSQSSQTIIKPRLAVDAPESLVDDMLLRLFEGMDGALQCNYYEFLDSRDKEAGKRYSLKCHSRMMNKVKNLDRVIRSNRYEIDQMFQSELKRKRAEELEYLKEAKKKAKLESIKVRQATVAARKLRIRKLKELEKFILQSKVSMVKSIKKRREEAKFYAEVLADSEEFESAAVAQPLSNNADIIPKDAAHDTTLDNEPDISSLPNRPLPKPSHVLLNGDVMSKAIYVWEFLHTFRDVSDGFLRKWPSGVMPSLDSLLLALKACDPSYRSVRKYTLSLQRSLDWISNILSESERVTESDLRIIHPLKLPNLIDATNEEANLLLNEFGVKFATLLLPDFEKIMGLDAVEHLVGDLRIPVNELTWREIARVVLTATLSKDLGATDGDVAALMKDRGFFTAPEPADRKALKLCRRRIRHAYMVSSELQESVYGFSSGAVVRIPAPNTPYPADGVCWTEIIGSLRNIPDSEGWLISEVIRAAALSICVFDHSPNSRSLQRSLLDCLQDPPISGSHGGGAKAKALDILAEDRKRKDYELQVENADAAAGQISAAETQQLTGQELYHRICLVYDYASVSPPVTTFDLWCKQLRSSIRHAHLVDLHPGEESEEYSSGSFEHNSEVKGAEEAIRASKLSISMQRCYLVIRDLMLHPQAVAFSAPVDNEILPDYYRFTSQPLSFSEIRSYLLSGGYNDSIYSFYCDVILVLENAKAYNNEGSTIAQAAHKITVVFERLFYEVVLSYDYPLTYSDCCAECRSPDPIKSNKVAVCDRCEAHFHLSCLYPPLTQPPRSEWYCPGCVEERGISMVHPFNTAHVRHPDLSGCVGEVVGMEQIRQTVVFVVEFPSGRELWSGKKIREYATKSALKVEDFINDSLFSRRSGAGPVDAVSSMSKHDMPSGYDFDDFDRVCGIAQGYCGWGSSRYLLPASLMNEHSIPAQKLSAVDPQFLECRKAIVSLGLTAGVNYEEMSAEEWSVVLSSLAQRALTALPMYGALQQNDAYLTNSYFNSLRTELDQKSLSLDRLLELAEKSNNLEDDEASGDEGSLGREVDMDIDDDDDAVYDEEEEDDYDDDFDFSDEEEKVKSAHKKSVPEPGDGISEDDNSSENFGSGDHNEKKSIRVDSDEEVEYAEGNALDANQLQKEAGEEVKLSASSQSLNEGETDADVSLGSSPSNGTNVKVESNRVSEAVCNSGNDSIENKWMRRCLSRMKGREDAYLVHLLVWDALSKMDVDNTAEEDDPTLKPLTMSPELGGAFFELARMVIVNACIVRPNDSLLREEWINGWDRTMKSLTFNFDSLTINSNALLQNSSTSQEITNGDSINNENNDENNDAPCGDAKADATQKGPVKALLLCSVCGSDEISLGSPIVWGQNRSEFESDRKNGTMVEISSAMLEQNTALLTGSNNGGWEALSSRLESCLWKYYDPDTAAIEDTEFNVAHRSYKCGSLPMHECCATYLLYFRQTKSEQAKRKEGLRMLEIISGIARGKSTSLGTDRHGSNYWIFRGSKILFVSTTKEPGKHSSDMATAASVLSTSSVPSTHLILNNGTVASEYCSSSIAWTVYESKDIGVLLKWLDARFERERLLLATLEMLFPDSVSTDDFAKQSDNAMEVDAIIPLEAVGEVHVENGEEEQELQDEFSDDGVDEYEDDYEMEDESNLATERRSQRQRVPSQHQSSINDFFSSCTGAAANGSAQKRTSQVSGARFRKGDHVLVDASAKNNMLWSGRILDIKAIVLGARSSSTSEKRRFYCKVRFDRWGAAYDGWYDEELLISSSADTTAGFGSLGDFHMSARTLAFECKGQFASENVLQPPHTLRSLRAASYMLEMDRACGYSRPPLSFSNCDDAVGLLRAGMLMIEAALPVGAIDSSDERWGDNFVLSWRYAVTVAYEPVSLMQCQLMLEYGVRTAWLKPAAMKLFSCLPSRIHALRNATLGMVAIRLWALDMAVKYEKVNLDEVGTMRGHEIKERDYAPPATKKARRSHNSFNSPSSDLDS